MKKFFTSLLILLSLSSYAELPKKFTVYTAYATAVPLCKAIFSEYDKAYNTQSQIVLKPGATGLIAMKAMQAETDLSVLCMTGVSDHVINKIQYPDSAQAFDDLKIISSFTTSGIVFVTGSDTKANTLPELLAQNKPITVGYQSFGIKTIASEILKNTKVTWVPYKNSLDSAVSLSDGSLDLYVDGSGLIPLIKSGKLKSLGYLSHTDAKEKQLGIDLVSNYPLETKIKLILGMSTSLKNANTDIQELENRLKYIYSLNIVQDAIRLAGYKPEYLSSQDSEEVFRLFKMAYVK